MSLPLAEIDISENWDSYDIYYLAGKLEKRAEDVQKKESREEILVKAEISEKAGRYLEAAEQYEHLEMFDKARELRDKEKQLVVKKTNISVD